MASHKFQVWLQKYKRDLSVDLPVKDVESSMFGPLLQRFVCNLTNINRTLNSMVKGKEDLNR